MVRRVRFASDCGLWFAVIASLTFVGSFPTAADEPAAPDLSAYKIDLSADDYEHWAFRPIERPAPPAPQELAAWIKNPIDAFVLHKLKAKGLEPSPPADARTWLRRVTFDLTGLPPTPEQVVEFLNDPSPQARERVVDRLLADPGYGIRWGRHWLDVVRYADTNGYERDGDKPHAWRYRDWVIDSLNRDKPYDRFITEQLAGDELADSSAETMIATTFLRLGTWDDEPAEPTIDRYEQLDDIVGTVSASFLGLTLRCARCHNHKFEPLSQSDYSSMLAIFEPLKRPQDARTDLDVSVGTPSELTEGRAAEARHKAAIAAIEEQVKTLDGHVKERYVAAGAGAFPPELFEAHRKPVRERTDAQRKLIAEHQKQFEEEVTRSRSGDEQKQRDTFTAAIETLQNGAPTPLPRAYIWEEPAGTPPVTQIFRRGNPATPAGPVAPAFPAVLKVAHRDLPPATAGAKTTQRRLGLAQWLADLRNPLTARVIVNRLWQGHFGDGLVATENDFGVMGSPPTHPELLDWLSAELREPSLPGSSPNDAWRLKRIHRLIVLSSTYAQASERREAAAKVDVENRLLWRFPYRRLDAEAVRDAVLAVNGQLNPAMGGPGVYPKIAREVLEGQSRPGEGWGKYDEASANRRAAYIFVKRAMLVPELELLDFADTTASCEQRPVSTIPTQALTLLNGEFLNDQSRNFARRLLRDAGNDRAAQIERAYRLALSRSPTGEEKQAALAFLERQSQQVSPEGQPASPSPGSADESALAALCLVLYNLNEFAYVD